MKQISVFDEANKKLLAEEIKSVVNPVYVCIGTKKVFADSLGPMVGEIVNNKMASPLVVYGNEQENITAENLQESVKFIRAMHPNKNIVIIDAAVGSSEQLGFVQYGKEQIIPGAATNKNLPSLGEFSIVGIVAEKGTADLFSTASEKLALVSVVAEFIAQSIIMANNG